VAIASSPAAVAHGNGLIEVFYALAGNKLGHTSWDGSWHHKSYSDEISGQPAVAARSATLYDVFWKYKASNLKHAYNQDGKWSDTVSLDTVITSDPAAVSWGDGRLDVFYRQGAQTMGHKYWNGSWGADTVDMTGATFGSSPAVASWANGRLDLFLRGTDGTVQHKAWDGSWHAWGEARYYRLVRGEGRLHHGYYGIVLG